MRRRTFIIGAGALTTGSAAAVIGTGAFTSASMERDVGIDVVNDDDGLLALEAGVESDMIRVDEDSGELTIDLGMGDDRGANVDSTYYFGSFEVDDQERGAQENNHAFRVVNNDTVAHDIELEFYYDGDSGNSGIRWGFSHWSDGTSVGIDHGRINEYGPGVSGNDVVYNNVGPGDFVAVTFRVDAADAGDDLSGTLHVSAE